MQSFFAPNPPVSLHPDVVPDVIVISFIEFSGKLLLTHHRSPVSHMLRIITNQAHYPLFMQRVGKVEYISILISFDGFIMGMCQPFIIVVGKQDSVSGWSGIRLIPSPVRLRYQKDLLHFDEA